MSAGAPSAMQFALRYPERCLGLLLMCRMALHEDTQMRDGASVGFSILDRIIDGSADRDSWNSRDAPIWLRMQARLTKPGWMRFSGLSCLLQPDQLV
jgi:hypothetical protein